MTKRMHQTNEAINSCSQWISMSCAPAPLPIEGNPHASITPRMLMTLENGNVIIGKCTLISGHLYAYDYSAPGWVKPLAWQPCPSEWKPGDALLETAPMPTPSADGAWHHE